MEFRFSVEIRVRLADTDAMGVAFHGSYFDWCDGARLDYLRGIGQLDRFLTGSETSNLIASASCDYHAPARFEELLTIGVRVARIGRTSITVEHHVARKADDAPVADLRTVHVLVDRRSGKPVPVPPDLRAALESFEGRPLA
jgi:acyl-CoA thioester hydrolase